MYYISVLKNGSTNSKKALWIARRQQQWLRDNGLKTHAFTYLVAVAAIFSSRSRITVDRGDTEKNTEMMLHFGVHGTSAGNRQQQQRHNDNETRNKYKKHFDVCVRIRLKSIVVAPLTIHTATRQLKPSSFRCGRCIYDRLTSHILTQERYQQNDKSEEGKNVRR